MKDKPVFTTFEAAKLCHVSPLSIINWVNAGKIHAFRTPGGHRRIRKEDLIRFMRDSTIPIPEILRESSGRAKVLIVDDEAAIRDLLSLQLTRVANPYEVMTAQDGFEAGRLVASFKPDIVLLDLRMPGVDGFQVCKTIKADPQSSNTIVLAMTGYHTPETESRILECGAQRCFSKPIDTTVLVSYIDALYEKESATRRRRS
jgi:excisionase family DNA binding protein